MTRSVTGECNDLLVMVQATLQSIVRAITLAIVPESEI